MLLKTMYTYGPKLANTRFFVEPLEHCNRGQSYHSTQ